MRFLVGIGLVVGLVGIGLAQQDGKLWRITPIADNLPVEEILTCAKDGKGIVFYEFTIDPSAPAGFYADIVGYGCGREESGK